MCSSNTTIDISKNSPDKDIPIITTIERLKAELMEKNIIIDTKEKHILQLQTRLEMERFGLERFGNDDNNIAFYTGFTSYKALIVFFKWIEPTAQNAHSPYYAPSDTVSLAGRPRCMPLIDEMFMFLCKLRVGLLEQDLSTRFNCSIPTVSRKFLTWVNLVYFVLGRIPIWLPRDMIDFYMPESFRKTYPSTRVIIDCTELYTEKPSSLLLNSQLYSNYKSNHTFKSLIGISPHGAVTFISPLYTGAMSDVEITRLSGLVDLCESGDSVMADKGFTIKNMLEPKGVGLNIPPFLGEKGRFSMAEVEATELIASVRIHVERVIRRVKENHFFDSVIPMTMAGSLNQVWTVACLLANFKGPMISAK